MFKNSNRMNDFELDNVVGGTVAEFEEILDAVNGKIGLFGDMSSAARKALDLLGPAGSLGKSAAYLALAPMFEKALKNDLDIDAYISVGWGGTGIRSTHNSYSINGKSDISLKNASRSNMIAGRFAVVKKIFVFLS